MLHVLNGDAMEPPFRAAGMPGRAVVWGDTAYDGPLRNGLAKPEDWAFRAGELERLRGIPAQAYRARMGACVQALAAARGDEVVLWFEQDLFCQLNFAHVMSRLAAAGARRVSLVAPEEALGAKRDPADLAGLFGRRVPAGPALLAWARRAWAAFAAPDPQALASLLRDDLAPWPALAAGVRQQLARYPDPRDGLQAVERAALLALEPAAMPFPGLFRAVAASPGVEGMRLPDLSVAAELLGLARGPRPLVALDPAPPAAGWPGDDAALRWRCSLTPAGRDVLAGRADALACLDLDRWVGGVHLRAGQRMWRWDAQAQRFA